MTHPATKEEFEARFLDNQRVSGRGLETMVHLPCPFCAAPDFLTYRILEVTGAMTRGGTCKECGRSLHAEYTYAPSMTSFHLVQTGGEDPPPWSPYPRAPRRDSDCEGCC